ncbi:MAG TPA: UDP-N-acetylmuramoyl-L-alanyl-D-glutamate--2,6-diaminopimelate ligase [Microlunatus sp.]|nr:UDP-N-acetylmuramoyl-L-alanyl-D-glutamate--2,6-diaminopimelate ligase [Microlunatus sp.]
MVAADGSSAPPSLRPSRLTGVGWADLGDLLGLSPGPVSRATVPDLRVSGVTADSRLVHPGDLYVAASGATVHGASFTAEAIDRGAVAVLTDRDGEERALVAATAASTPVAVVGGPRALIPALADRIYGRPSRQLQLFGITGTNGKTTTAYLLQSALRAAGLRVGLIGTIGYQVDDRRLEGPRTTVTTPEAAELHALLAVMLEEGADAVVMEVSSHALALGRTAGLRFAVAAFTNFGSDHLDFHGDVASYFAAKASLFTAERADRAVINVDDARGDELIRQALRENLSAVRSVSLDGAADYAAAERSEAGQGRTAVTASTPQGPVPFTLGLPGEFNVRNALTALAMADLVGVDLDRAASGFADAVVPGRMQRVDLGDGAATVFVDFAHTPQAVSAVLAGLSGHRRIVVLGCGGDRDPEKRGPMGAAAAAAADLVVVTDDNPRSEDPAAIRAQVLAGARAEAERNGRAVTIVDGGKRRDAIAAALSASGPDDIVAVLGKGHERGQEVAGRVLPFADEDAIRDVWAELHPVGSEGGSR